MPYRRVKTSLGHRYVMRICEDEVRERDLFHAAVVFLPMVAILAFSLAAGLFGG